MTKKIEDLEVNQNKRLNASHYILELRSAEPLPDIRPGQFAEVHIEGSPSTFLRRPFSIHAIDKEAQMIRLLIKEAGEGTRHLGLLDKGDKVNLIYPLGKGFSLPEGKKALLIGGGCGVAPLLFLSQWLSWHKIEQTVLIGGKTADDILEADTYRSFAGVEICTEDGSKGVKGMVSDHKVFHELNTYDMVYSCGPEAMMKVVARKASEANVCCEVSLENTMACGIGACLCCVVDTQRGHQCVCTEGPVFNVKELKWLD